MIAVFNYERGGHGNFILKIAASQKLAAARKQGRRAMCNFRVQQATGVVFLWGLRPCFRVKMAIFEGEIQSAKTPQHKTGRTWKAPGRIQRGAEALSVFPRRNKKRRR